MLLAVELVDLKCRQCGAALPTAPIGGVYRCQYCGHAYEQAPAPAPAAPVIQIQIQAPERAPRAALGGGRASSGARGVGCLVPILVAAGIFVWWRTQGSGASGLIGGRLIWDSVAGQPQIVAVPGGEVAIGRVRMEDDQLYIAAVFPATPDLKWRVGPLGTYSEGYQSTHFAVVRDRVVVTDFRAGVHLVDASTGRELKKTTLTDRVTSMCPSGAGMWIGTVDQRGALLDLQTGATREAPRPTVCDDPWSAPVRHDRGAAATAPKVVGFAAHRTLVDGDVGVAGGVRSPGTAIPMAAGFDPRSAAPRWTAVLPVTDPSTARASSNEYDALAAGRYVTIYGVGDKGWHVTALDGKTGARLWDTPLPKLFAVDSIHGIVASGAYVYVVRTSSLDVLAAPSGKRLGAIGNEIYRD